MAHAGFAPCRSSKTKTAPIARAPGDSENLRGKGSSYSEGLERAAQLRRDNGEFGAHQSGDGARSSFVEMRKIFARRRRKRVGLGFAQALEKVACWPRTNRRPARRVRARFGASRQHTAPTPTRFRLKNRHYRNQNGALASPKRLGVQCAQIGDETAQILARNRHGRAWIRANLARANRYGRTESRPNQGAKPKLRPTNLFQKSLRRSATFGAIENFETRCFLNQEFSPTAIE